MQILSVNDDEFKKYGRVVDNVDFTELIQELKRTPIPSGVVYEPAVKELEALPIRLDISSVVYGEMPIHAPLSPTVNDPNSVNMCGSSIPLRVQMFLICAMISSVRYS